MAKPACEFLVSIGPPLAPQMLEVLGSRDDILKAVVLREIVSRWPSDDVRGLSSAAVSDCDRRAVMGSRPAGVASSRAAWHRRSGVDRRLA